MQIQPIYNYKYNQCFGAVYAGDTEFSKCQEIIVKSLAKEFRALKSYLRGNSLENHYKNKGYDFIIRPYGKESVSLNAYKGMRIEKSEQGKRAIFSNDSEKLIGKYDINSINHLAEDLKQSFSIIG